MARLFGTDGVRGVANRELTASLAYHLGRAATFHFGCDHQRPQVVIGRDTRISGAMLEAALAAGICSAGGDAIILGVVPTPAVAFITRQLGAQAGVMISASHNPFPDNGIKFFAADGYKLPDEVEDEIERLIDADDDKLPFPEAADIGCTTFKPNLAKNYVEYVCQTTNANLSGLRIAIDCANGAAASVAPEIWRQLGVQATIINSQPNGVNINEKCGSTHMEGLIELVKNGDFDLGLAYDGDADRCLAVDAAGNFVDGDQLMLICAKQAKADGVLVDNTLVATVMSNIGLFKACKRDNIEVAVTPVGDRYVLERMREKDWQLGGEQSGHIIFSQHSTTGDGILTSIQLVAAVKNSGLSLKELAGQMKRYPQVLVNVRVASKDGWQDNKAIADAISQAEQQLGDEGRILVRPSGTEQLIRVMAEGPDQAFIEQLAADIADVIKSEQGES